jgi:hypothetical protein
MEFFFERCHRPYIARRHGEIAYVNTLRDFNVSSTKANCCWSAATPARGGALNRAVGDTYEILYFGILDGEEARLHDGTASRQLLFQLPGGLPQGLSPFESRALPPVSQRRHHVLQTQWKGRLGRRPAVSRPIRLALGRLTDVACGVLERDPFLVCRMAA